MVPPLIVATVHGPCDVSKGRSLYCATRSPFVPRWGATASHTFFLAIWLGGSGSPGWPLNMMRSPIAHASGGFSSSTMVCPGSDAASTIAWDSIPRILAGLRLHTAHATMHKRVSGEAEGEGEGTGEGEGKGKGGGEGRT